MSLAVSADDRSVLWGSALNAVMNTCSPDPEMIYVEFLSLTSAQAEVLVILQLPHESSSRLLIISSMFAGDPCIASFTILNERLQNSLRYLFFQYLLHWVL